MSVSPLSRKALSSFKLLRPLSSSCLRCLLLSAPAACRFACSALICLNVGCLRNPSWFWICGYRTFCRPLWPSVFVWLRSSSVKLSLTPARTLPLLVLGALSVPQHFIACWELLAQLALLWLLHSLLPAAHPPVHFSLKCDNASCDSASWKGISMARRLCHVISCFCLRQRFWHISVHIDHVPGFLNTTADRLSRLSSPASLGFLDSMRTSPPWHYLLALPSPCSFPASVELARFVSALS